MMVAVTSLELISKLMAKRFVKNATIRYRIIKCTGYSTWMGWISKRYYDGILGMPGIFIDNFYGREFFSLPISKSEKLARIIYNQGFVLLNFYCNKNAIIANIQ